MLSFVLIKTQRFTNAGSYSYHYAYRVCYLFIRSSIFNAGSFPIGMCPVLVRYLLDPAIHRWIYTYHFGSGVCYLLDSALPEPSLSLSLCVRCLLVVFYLFIYLFICVFSKLFKILSQPSVFDRFFSY